MSSPIEGISFGAQRRGRVGELMLMLRYMLTWITAILCQLSACVAVPLASDTISIRISQDPDTLNPFLTGMAVAQDVARPVLSGLVAVDDRLRIYPELATSVPLPENGGVTQQQGNLVVTYQLRPGIKWHDGAPFTSRDVAFTWRFALNQRARIIDRTGYDRILKVETPEPYLVRIVFRGIYAPYLKLFHTVLPEHLLAEEVAPNAAKFNQKPVGTGPYRIIKWVPGDHIELVANDNYFRGKPNIKRLILQILPDDNTALVRLKAGALDVYQAVALSHLPVIKKMKNITLVSSSTLLYEHLLMNTAQSPFDDRRVRKAIALAIDKETISREIYSGMFKPAWCDQPPLSWAHDPSLQGKTDRRQAMALLEEAGWRSGSDGIRMKGTQRLSFNLLLTGGKKPRELAALLIRRDLRAIGIEMRLQAIPAPLFFSTEGPMKQKTFAAAMWAWDTDVDPDPTNFWHSARILPQGSNISRLRNAHLDSLLELAARTIDREKRQALYRQISRLLFDEVPDIPLLYWVTLSACSSQLVGWRPGPLGGLWNSYEWKMVRLI
ncbi:MAG: peptide ABC transporter substrate-binding protein [Cyanobacteria bacterium NC_groundwater_1444_Ag_S-0.65um_54_12]|nr:peptide ABC transporter substrate-binding protein [Cyanobacteria bacterium NC_groundwater_1444_Ag_S-0.65um_54_12]